MERSLHRLRSTLGQQVNRPLDLVANLAGLKAMFTRHPDVATVRWDRGDRLHHRRGRPHVTALGFGWLAAIGDPALISRSAHRVRLHPDD